MQSVSPKSGTAAPVSEGNNPDTVRVVDVQNRERKSPKMKLLQGVHILDERKLMRVKGNFAQCIPHSQIEVGSELFIAFCIKRGGGLPLAADSWM